MSEDTMSKTQERARTVVKAYLALHDALRNAVLEVPLPMPADPITAQDLVAQTEYSLYNNLLERFVGHLKTDAYWRLTGIAIGGEGEDA